MIFKGVEQAMLHTGKPVLERLKNPPTVGFFDAALRLWWQFFAVVASISSYRN